MKTFVVGFVFILILHFSLSQTSEGVEVEGVIETGVIK